MSKTAVITAAAYEARKATARQTAQGAQNVPQMRAAMADMQAQIDALKAIVEAGR